jgi:hypothetical protein
MGISHWVARFIGATCISIALLTFLIVVFLGSLAAQSEQLPEIVDSTADTFIEENEGAVIAILAESGELESDKDLCDLGEITEEECNIDLGNELVQEQIEEAKQEWIVTLQDAFEPLEVLIEQKVVFWYLIFFVLVIGFVFLLYGTQKNLLKMIRFASWRVGILALFPLIFFKYVIGLDQNGFKNLVGSYLTGAPGVLLDFLAAFAFTFFKPVFVDTYNMVLILTVSGFVLWGLTHLYSFSHKVYHYNKNEILLVKKKKSKKKKNVKL